MMATTTIEERARERLAQQERARLEQTMQELHAEDERTRQEQERQTARAALEREAAKLERESQAAIDKLTAQCDAALDALIAAVHARGTQSSALGSQALSLGYDTPYEHGAVRIGPVTIKPIAPRWLASTLVDKVLARYYPRGTS